MPSLTRRGKDRVRHRHRRSFPSIPDNIFLQQIFDSSDAAWFGPVLARIGHIGLETQAGRSAGRLVDSSALLRPLGVLLGLSHLSQIQ